MDCGISTETSPETPLSVKSVLQSTVPPTSINKLVVIWFVKLDMKADLRQAALQFRVEHRLPVDMVGLQVHQLHQLLQLVAHQAAVHREALALVELVKLVLLEVPVRMVRTETMEHLEAMANMAQTHQLVNNHLQQTSVSIVLQDLPDQLEIQVQKVQMVNLEAQEMMVLLVKDHNLAPLDQLDHQELQDLQDNLDSPEVLDKSVKHQDSPDLPAQLVHQDNQVNLVQMEIPDLHLLDPQDLQETKDLQDQMAILALPDNQAPTERPGREVNARTVHRHVLLQVIKLTEPIRLLNIDNKNVVAMLRNLISLSFMFISFKNKK